MFINIRVVLHYFFILVILHGLAVVAINNYGGFTTFQELCFFLGNFITNLIAGPYIYVWRHAATPPSDFQLLSMYSILLVVCVVVMNDVFETPQEDIKSNIFSILFGMLMAHVGVSIFITNIEPDFSFYPFLSFLLKNVAVVLMSVVYVVFSANPAQIINIKNNQICTFCGFNTGLLFLLLSCSGIFIQFFFHESSFIKVFFIHFFLILLALILSIFVTSVLLKDQIKNQFIE